ncbi:element excision factor XisI family protein [Leptothoe sp. EHU-05/26/07-4]
MIVILGGKGYRYEHSCTVNIDIIDDKIWIQRDGTEDDFAIDLENAGIPKEHIFLSFKPPELRPTTDYATCTTHY